MVWGVTTLVLCHLTLDEGGDMSYPGEAVGQGDRGRGQGSDPVLTGRAVVCQPASLLSLSLLMVTSREVGAFVICGEVKAECS